MLATAAATAILSVILLPTLVAASARVVGINKILDARAGPTTGEELLTVSVAPNRKWIYDPPSLSATVGQQIKFQFPADPPVSVTQSSSDAPCTYLDFSNGTIGFDSQLQSSVEFLIEITDLEPIYFHCKHPGHCGMGMVGVINAPSSGAGSFESYQTTAVSLGQSAPNDSTTGPPTAGNIGATGRQGNPLTAASGAAPTVASLTSYCAFIVAVVILTMA